MTADLSSGPALTGDKLPDTGWARLKMQVNGSNENAAWVFCSISMMEGRHTTSEDSLEDQEEKRGPRGRGANASRYAGTSVAQGRGWQFRRWKANPS